MNNECLYKRLCAQRILQECIERTNYAVEQLNERCSNKLIEQSCDAYHALMSTIEPNFDTTLARETTPLAPALYWLESEIDVDDLCSTILDQNGITVREATILAMLRSTSPQPIELTA
jgi:hypothetical protein